MPAYILRDNNIFSKKRLVKSVFIEDKTNRKSFLFKSKMESGYSKFRVWPIDTLHFKQERGEPFKYVKNSIYLFTMAPQGDYAMPKINIFTDSSGVPIQVR